MKGERLDVLQVVTACGQRLKEIDLTGKIVTLDAKLTQREVVGTKPSKGQGDDTGTDRGKENPDWVEIDKGQDRKREIWLVDSREMEEYMQETYGWRGIRLSGYGEDGLHGRKIGFLLSPIRNCSINTSRTGGG